MPTSTPLPPERIAELGLPDAGSVGRLEKRARCTFQKIEPVSTAVPVQAPKLLEDSIRVLEQMRVMSALAEVADILKIETVGDFQARILEVERAVRLSGRIDPLAPFEADPVFQEALQRSEPASDPNDEFPVRVNAFYLRAVDSLVAYCPIEDLVRIGHAIGMPELGHRCRLSYDWLRAWVRRHTVYGQATLHIVGRAYSEGRLSLDEAAHLLGMPRSDAVAWLEEHGHARDVSVIVLTPEERERRFARMREDRLARGGHAVFDRGLLLRDVVATQRIEGVDARPWVQTYPL
jgi:hypothetical protein